MKTIVAFLILFCVSGYSVAQSYVYIVDELAGVGSVYLLVGNECVLAVTLNDAPVFVDIAGGEAGLYGITAAGDIHLIQIAAGITSEIGLIDAMTGHVALTGDSNERLYSIDIFEDLYRYDVMTDEYTVLFNVGDITPGDVAFYRGQLAFPAGQAAFPGGPLVIRAIDLDTYDITTIYCLPQEITYLASIFGLTNDFDSCGNELLLVGNTNNDVFRIDVENNSYENLNVTYDVEPSGIIYGLASYGDVSSSDCDEVITEADCGANGVVDIGVIESMILYPNPSKDFVLFEDHFMIERVDFYSINGERIKEIENPSSREIIIDLAAGLYVAQIKYRNGLVRNHKLIKQ